MAKKQLPNRNNENCEICGISGSMLDRHHIVPRSDPNSTDKPSNLAIICANCHREVHAKNIIIEGVFGTTAGGRLFWHRKGEKHHIRVGVILNDDGTATIVEK